MNISEMRSKADADLKKELLELREEQFKLRMQQGTGQLGNPARFKEVRREIARIKTVLNEKARSAS
jgi:large subunit ribosomal protein L29